MKSIYKDFVMLAVGLIAFIMIFRNGCHVSIIINKPGTTQPTTVPATQGAP